MRRLRGLRVYLDDLACRIGAELAGAQRSGARAGARDARARRRSRHRGVSRKSALAELERWREGGAL